MRSACTFIAVVWMLCWGGLASAKDATFIGSLTNRHDSVTKVMGAAGCNQSWLSQVISDSGINPAKLRYLPVGQKLYIRGTCKGNPPEQVVRISNMLLQLDSSSSQLQNMQTELASLRSYRTTAVRRIESLIAETDKLAFQVANLKDQLARAKQGGSEATVAGGGKGLNPYLLVGVGMVAGVMLAYLATLWFGRRKISFPSRLVVKDHDLRYEFILVGADEPVPGTGDVKGRYKCLKCGEHNLLAKNVKRHIGKEHVADRVAVVHPDPRQAVSP